MVSSDGVVTQGRHRRVDTKPVMNRNGEGSDYSRVTDSWGWEVARILCPGVGLNDHFAMP